MGTTSVSPLVSPLLWTLCTLFLSAQYGRLTALTSRGLTIDELAAWSQPWNLINEPYKLAYLRDFPPSDPEEDFDNRLKLYGIRVNLLDSIRYEVQSEFRKRYRLLHYTLDVC